MYTAVDYETLCFITFLKSTKLTYIGLGLSAVVGLDRLVSIDTAVLCPSDLVLAVRARGADVGLRPRGMGEVGRAPTSLAEGPILLTKLCREPMLSLCLS